MSSQSTPATPVSGRRPVVSNPLVKGESTVTNGLLWTFVGISVGQMIGLDIDAWGHITTAAKGGYESPLVPWHAVFYAFLGAAILLMMWVVRQSLRKGLYPLIPTGLRTILAGTVILAIAFPGDLIWHALFGFEVNAEAELSPSHILLIGGMLLVILGVVRYLWMKYPKELPSNARWLMVVAYALAMAYVGSYLFYASTVGANSLIAQEPPAYGISNVFWPTHNIAMSFMLGAVVTLVFLLPLVTRYKLPFGACILILGVGSITQSLFDTNGLIWRGIVAMLLAGLVIDIARFLLGVHQFNDWRRGVAFAAIVPIAMGGFTELLVALTTQTWWLRIHGWLGVITISTAVAVILTLFWYHQWPAPEQTSPEK